MATVNETAVEQQKTVEPAPGGGPGVPPGEGPGPDLPLTIIEARPGWRIIDVRELWRYRELLYFLSWRDILVRYKQTVVGVAWAVLRPLLTMLVFVVVFEKIAGLSSGDVPYPMLVFAGMLPWQFFASSLTESTSTLSRTGPSQSPSIAPSPLKIRPASGRTVCRYSARPASRAFE